MKVGILTFHGANNYGAVLQAYALVERLKENGIDAQIVDYRSKVFDKYKTFRTHLYKKAPYLLGVDLFKFPAKNKRNRHFDSFRKRFLPVSQEAYFSESDLSGLTDQYDFFICGSDQIWNQELTKGSDPVYFLDFVTDPLKKIAYAPSVALNRLTEFQIAKIACYLSGFSALSIREQEAIDILQPYCEKSIMKACDPVFLPDIRCYDRICSDKFEGGNYVFLYIVGNAARFQNVISYAAKTAKKEGLDLYYLIDGDKTFCHIKGKNVFGCSPEDFLSLIKNAGFIISNSFHATAFSILFSKQFVTFLKQGTGSRMSDLLSEFHLQDRILGSDNRTDPFDTQIDYSQLQQTLRAFRKNSDDYLLVALGRSDGDSSVPVKADRELIATRQQNYKELLDFVEWRRKCILVRHKDARIVEKSRSGGIFTALSDAVLAKGGVVYGCKMEGVTEAVHQRAATREERDLFRGSKYIQSEMGDCFKQVKEDLKNGLTVLFSGTGCQVAALYSFLGGKDISRLFTVEIVCHGVPSQRIWVEYLEWMKKIKGKEITSVNFRDKRYGWKAHLETVMMDETVFPTSTYRVLFLSNAFLRPACYECQFSGLRRKSDITIGDAWGIERIRSQLNDNRGCSIALINSEKGRELFESCQQDLIIQNADLEEFLQPNLVHPTARPDGRQKYWDCLENKGFDTLARQYGRPGPLRRIKDRKIILMANFAKTRNKNSAYSEDSNEKRNNKSTSPV